MAKAPGWELVTERIGVRIPGRIETRLLLKLATARSTRPSPLKSPDATPRALDPRVYVAGDCSVPSPLPKNTLTAGMFPSATTTSILPSPFTSVVRTEGPAPPPGKDLRVGNR